MKSLVIGSWYPTEFIVQRVGESMFGKFVDFSCADFDHPAYKQIAAKYNKAYKRLLDNNAFSGYMMVRMVAEAIQKSKSVDPKVLAEVIRSGTFDQPGYGWQIKYTEWGEMKDARPILYTYEKGDPGLVNAGADWRPKTVFRSPPVELYVPKD